MISNMFRFIFPRLIFKYEKWKWNPEYRIYVSNLGHFKDEYKDNLPCLISKKGYVSVKTRCGLKAAHRLVLQTWRPCPDYNNLTVDHLNHNKRDNSLQNLEWVSQKENQRRARENYGKYDKESLNKYISIAEKAVNEMALFKNNILITTNRKAIERIAKKIKKAVETDTLYCGKKWNIS